MWGKVLGWCLNTPDTVMYYAFQISCPLTCKDRGNHSHCLIRFVTRQCLHWYTMTLYNVLQCWAQLNILAPLNLVNTYSLSLDLLDNWPEMHSSILQSLASQPRMVRLIKPLNNMPFGTSDHNASFSRSPIASTFANDCQRRLPNCVWNSWRHRHESSIIAHLPVPTPVVFEPNYLYRQCYSLLPWFPSRLRDDSEWNSLMFANTVANQEWIGSRTLNAASLECNGDQDTKIGRFTWPVSEAEDSRMTPRTEWPPV